MYVGVEVPDPKSEVNMKITVAPNPPFKKEAFIR
jgi:hypothetical protein